MTEDFQILIQQKPTLVVDITYLCNATCRYCRWGTNETPGRTSRSLGEILIPVETLTNLGTKRVVISGGEPRLHPELDQILHYFSKRVEEVIIITNAYGLDINEVEKLLDWGATGFTVSLDSVDPMESFLTRFTPPQLQKEMLTNIETISKMPRNFEFGINSVVSHVTGNWTTVSNLLKFGSGIGIDFIKFQPVFDDGFVAKNSPDLLLSKKDVPSLLEIAKKLDTVKHPLTNPSEFWADLAVISEKRFLPSSGCGIGPGDSISIRGDLKICFWVDSSSYGISSEPVGRSDLLNIQSGFEGKKQKCKVDFHCFCNQRINHTWMKE